VRFAKWVFWAAGVYGLVVTLPLYFSEEQYGHDHPPAVTHPEFYYGFAGLCLSWQVLFLIIGSFPVRLRPVMPAAVLEKASFSAVVPVLYAMGRVPLLILGMAGVDLLLGILFIAAYLQTPRE
jgi:hypothetical protein